VVALLANPITCGFSPIITFALIRSPTDTRRARFGSIENTSLTGDDVGLGVCSITMVEPLISIIVASILMLVPEVKLHPASVVKPKNNKISLIGSS